MQMNFVITPEFEMDIFDVMIHARIRTRSEAVRHAVHMVAEVMRDRAKREPKPDAEPRAVP
jgi:SHS2 domain-containing protein